MKSKEMLTDTDRKELQHWIEHDSTASMIYKVLLVAEAEVNKLEEDIYNNDQYTLYVVMEKDGLVKENEALKLKIKELEDIIQDIIHGY